MKAVGYLSVFLALVAVQTGHATCEVTSQQAPIGCVLTAVLPTSEFTQDLVVREPTEASGWFDHITLEAGAQLRLRGTARWRVTVEPDAELIVHGMAKEILVKGGRVHVRGMADEIRAMGGEVIISGVVGRVTGSEWVKTVHGAVVGGRPETRGQPGEQFPFTPAH